MKNNRLTNSEVIELRSVVERLRNLADMENALFSSNLEKDLLIKNGVRPYMMWFKCEAYTIEKILDSNI